MVKKGSILSRLADRFRSGSGVRVNEGDPIGRSGAHSGGARGGSRLGGEGAATGSARTGRVDPQVGAGPVGAGPVGAGAVGDGAARSVPGSAFAREGKPTRKLSEREEAMVALSGHFQELAVLLRGVHTRMDDKLGRAAYETGQNTILAGLRRPEPPNIARSGHHADSRRRSLALG